MRVALVNPPWSFEGSAYCGCRAPHSPLELAYARTLLVQRGHVVRLLDAQMSGADLAALEAELWSYRPDVTVLTTAPSYLFGRCAPPELRVPIQTARMLRPYTERLFVVGPHVPTTPGGVLGKIDADAVVLGECEAVLPELVEAAPAEYGRIDSIAYRTPGTQARDGDAAIVVQGTAAAMDLQRLPALRWQPAEIAAHRHHHQRFDCAPNGPAAEMEASRGCPHACSFCAKETFRNRYRTRPLQVVLDELDGLIAQGVRYVYFIDEIFLPHRALLEALLERDIQFGVQLRIDNWSEELLGMLGRAGCVSIEAGIESLTPQGTSLRNKQAKLSAEQLTGRLICAKRGVPFVQANLLGTSDDPRRVAHWRAELSMHGVWSNQPMPSFPYPGSPEYRLDWGPPDDLAGERAQGHYLKERVGFSDVEERAPRPLGELEA
ncbi:MAG: TIGR04295 family B12-binding domain-containing radical SAM protein [Deltaproteobacteria bacterium]